MASQFIPMNDRLIEDRLTQLEKQRDGDPLPRPANFQAELQLDDPPSPAESDQNETVAEDLAETAVHAVDTDRGQIVVPARRCSERVPIAARR